MSGLTGLSEDPTNNGLHVQGQGNSVRVATNSPHLVSLGTGRLSTAVTLHPIKQGRITIGSDPTCDIYVQGTGVCSHHSRIENSHGVVTLYPVNGTTLVDGVPVKGATRLSQGSMLTIGRSNYLRFNHPEEAKLMKSVLPNTHLSMAPIQFVQSEDSLEYQGNQNQLECYQTRESPMNQNPDSIVTLRDIPKRKPPVAPKKPSRDYDQYSDTSSEDQSKWAPKSSNIMAKVSKFEYYAKSQQKNVGRSQFYTQDITDFSPKVFKSDSLTVNTPAKDVLGNQKIIIFNDKYNETKNCSYANVFVKNQSSKIDDIVRNFNERSCANADSCQREKNGGCQKPTKYQKPSPSFDRNPELNGGQNVNCQNDRIVMAENRKDEAHQDRLKDENQREAETARLEEILNICAEYEKQITSGAPLTPTERKSHSKIITNGSLPRSYGMSNPNFVQMSDGFYRFDTSQKRSTSKPPTQREVSNYENVDPNRLSTPPNNLEIPQTPEVTINSNDPELPTKHFPITELSSPILIRKIARNAQNHTSDYDKKCLSPIGSPYENALYSNVTFNTKSPGTQSPRTRIKTTVSNKNNTSPPQYFVFPTPTNEKESDFNRTDSKYENVEFVDNLNDKGIEKRLSLNENIPMIDDNRVENDMECRKSIVEPDVDVMKIFENQDSVNEVINETSSKDVKTNDVVNTEVAKTCESKVNETKMNSERRDNIADIPELTEFEQDCKTMDQEDYDKVRQDFDILRDERRKLLTEINEIKRQMTQIRTQEDEILRELEMEKALIKGEYDSEIAILNLEQDRRTRLIERVRVFEKSMKEIKDKQDTKQREMRDRLEIATLKVERIEHDIKHNLACDEELQNARDILENERKLFEDLEFQHLEEETELLAQREELQNELAALTNKIDAQKRRILTLKSEASHNLNSALNETRLLQAEFSKNLNKVEGLTVNVQKIEKSLKELGDKLNSERPNSPESDISVVKFEYSPQNSDGDDFSNYEMYKIELNDKLKSVDQMSRSMIVDSDKRDLADLIDHVTLNKEQESPNKKKGFWERNFDSLSRLKNKKVKNNDIMSQSLNENMMYNNDNTENNVGKFEKSNSFKLKASKIPTFSALGKIIKKESFSKKSAKDDNKNRYVKNNKITVNDNKYFNKRKPDHSLTDEKTIDSLKVSIDVNKNRKSCGDVPNSQSFGQILSESGKIPSQDDIDRISKVTLDAPIFESESDMNSLDRKTVESLKEVERNRMALLEEQGCQVLECEREKIQELKKRVHDETKKNWESRKNSGKSDSETINNSSLLSNDSSYCQNDSTNSQNDSSNLQNDSYNRQNDSSNRQNDRSTLHNSSVCQNESNITDNSIVQSDTSVVNESSVNDASAEANNTSVLSDSSDVKNDSSIVSDSSVVFRRNDSLRRSNKGDIDMSVSMNATDFDSSGITSSFEELHVRNSRTDSLSSSNVLEDDKQRGRPLSDSSDISNDNILSHLSSSVPRRNRMLQNRADVQRPLTRYLPIDRDDFDLRQHIESAGHQVNLCPHVLINSTSCRGYLHKLGAKFHQWSKRWFVFDRESKTLIYYSDKSEKKPRGGAYFQVIEEVYMDHGNESKSPNPQTTFVVKTRQRRYYLMSQSSEAVRIWIDVIFTGAQGYMGYFD